MKMLGFITFLAVTTVFSALGQNGATNQTSLQNPANITRLPPLSQPKPLPKVRVTEPSTSGIIPAFRKGTLATPAPEPYSDFPNPSSDVLNRPPRGIVLWSYNF
jgi:hypothetical protein